MSGHHDFDQRVQILRRLAIATNKRLSDGTLEVFLEHLEDVDTPALDEAVRRSIREDQKFPSVARVRELVRSVHAGLHEGIHGELGPRPPRQSDAQCRAFIEHLKAAVRADQLGRPRPPIPAILREK